jgi:hypothetical protein
VGQSLLLFSDIHSFLSHSFFSQSFILFSVIPSFLSHSFFSQSFLLFSVIPVLFSVIPVLFSVIPSFSVILPARPHLSAPSSSFFPSAQRLPKSPAVVIQPGPARQGSAADLQKELLSPQNPNPSPATPETPAPLPFFLRRADALASPWSGRSAAPQATTTPAIGPPRRLEPSLVGN